MAHYSVRYSIHLIPYLAPLSWPNPVFYDAVHAAESVNDLKARIEETMWRFLKQNAVITLKETNKPLQDDIDTLDLRLYIPLHIVQYIEHKTTKMVTDIPDIEDEGLFIQ